MFARELARERMRHEHPGWPEARMARELMRLAFLPAPMPARLEKWISELGLKTEWNDACRGAGVSESK